MASVRPPVKEFQGNGWDHSLMSDLFELPSNYAWCWLQASRGNDRVPHLLLMANLPRTAGIVDKKLYIDGGRTGYVNTTDGLEEISALSLLFSSCVNLQKAQCRACGGGGDYDRC